MKAVLLKQHGNLEKLHVGEALKPSPGPGEVLIKMQFAALNHLDLWVVGGILGIEIPMPHIPGADGAGEVVASGPGTKRF